MNEQRGKIEFRDPMLDLVNTPPEHVATTGVPQFTRKNLVSNCKHQFIVRERYALYNSKTNVHEVQNYICQFCGKVILAEEFEK